MRNVRTVTIALASVVLVVVVLQGSPEHRSDDARRSVRSPQRTSADHEQRLSRTPLRAIQPVPAVPTDSAASTIAPHQVPSTAEAAQRESSDPVADVTPDDILASVENRFQADKVEHGSTANVQQQAKEHLAQGLGAGSVLRDVECRALICKAEIDQIDLAAHRAFLQASIAPGWQGPAMATLKPGPRDGRVVTVVYLGRTADSLADTVPLELLDMPGGDPPRAGERVPAPP
jgi:hypothetical protein